MSTSSSNAAEHAREADRMDALARKLEGKLASAQARGDQKAAQRIATELGAARDQAAWHRAYS